MRVVADLEVPVPPERVWPHVELLDRYPPWMHLVHRVHRLGDDNGEPVWDVELRARVGPFTRSKRLRMRRTIHEHGRFVRFERVEHDERDHAAWTLSTTLEGDESSTTVRADLYYGGELWAGDGLLRRVLDDEIQRAKSRLSALLSQESPTP